MFPILNLTYAPSFVFNHLKMHASAKNLSFEFFFTQKNLSILIFLKKLGLVRQIIIFFDKISKKKKIKVFIFFYKYFSVYHSFKILSTPSKFFFISHKALLLLERRTNNSVFIISTSRGLLTHHEALKNKIGGKLIGFISY